MAKLFIIISRSNLIQPLVWFRKAETSVKQLVTLVTVDEHVPEQKVKFNSTVLCR